MFAELEKAIGPILPGLVVAAIFIVGSFAMRIKFRGDPIAERLKRPSSICYV